METHEKFLEGGGSRISKWKPSGDIYKDMNVSKVSDVFVWVVVEELCVQACLPLC